MFYQIELFLLGVATVFDTVLLLIVLERVNRAQVSNWLYALLAGLWLVHGSSFAHELLRDIPGSMWLGRGLVWFTCAGLLLLPSAMLHAALWLNFGRPTRDWRYALLYAPLLALPFIGWHLSITTTTTFIDAVASMASPYLYEVVLFNLIAMGLFLRVRNRLTVKGANRFFMRLTSMLAWMTIVLVFYYNVIADPKLEEITRAVLILSPLFPALLFVWHALNQRLLPLVMERTLLYGATIIIVLFLHRLLIEPIASSIQARAHIDILLIEGWLFVAIVLAWPPLRSRFREAARYLLSSNVHQIREATGKLSLEMSQLSSQSSDELSEWMAEALRQAIKVDSVSIVMLTDSTDVHAFRCTESRALRDASGTEELTGLADGNSPALEIIYSAITASEKPYLFRGQRLSSDVEQAMLRLGAMWIFRMQFRTVRGMVLLGPRLRNDRLADEQLISLSLLVEQFAATLHNRQLEQMRLRAERHAMQQEKLSILGLLTGTLSHELRNPLSSVRTIAQLMLEDLGPSSAHARDVTLILGEIDRLNQTTTRLLDFSRPPSDQPDRVCPDRVISRLLSILEHLARQRHVILEVKLTSGDQQVNSSDASLSEILFNLMKNAIEAASLAVDTQGKVSVETHAEPNNFVCIVSDNGPGMTQEFQANMFEPFVTGKADGTGLGLYIVGERVRELQGTIGCDSQPGKGTRFEVRLPQVDSPQHDWPTRK